MSSEERQRTIREHGSRPAAAEKAEAARTGREAFGHFTEQCLSNALRLETYIQDAEREGDAELADFFRRAQGESRKGAEQGKDQLRRRLAS